MDINVLRCMIHTGSSCVDEVDVNKHVRLQLPPIEDSRRVTGNSKQQTVRRSCVNSVIFLRPNRNIIFPGLLTSWRNTSELFENEELTYQQAKGDQQTKEGKKEGILGKQKKCRICCVAHSNRHICSHHAIHLLEGASKCIELHGF
ncbi:hypothetical protein QTP88_024548 [Uroleucon formosanum]